MYQHKRASSAVATIVALIFSFSVICNAQVVALRKGKLVLSNLTIPPDIPGLDRPPCKSPPVCDVLIRDLKKSQKLARLSQVGILVTALNGDINLGAFVLEIHSSNKKVVFATQPVNQVVKSNDKAKPRNSAYLFVLDGIATEAGNKFFVDENTIAFRARVSGKGEAAATFSIVNTEGAR